MKVKDVCIYAPGDTNKNNKEGKTSWDSFSYFLMMNHNVYTHIRSVQEGNKAMDSGSYPAWLVNETITRESVAEAIDQVFAINDRDEALDFIDHNQKLLDESTRYKRVLLVRRQSMLLLNSVLYSKRYKNGDRKR